MKDTVLVLDPMEGFISTRIVLPTKRRKNYFKDGGGLLAQIDSSVIDDAFQKSFPIKLIILVVDLPVIILAYRGLVVHGTRSTSRN